MELPRNTTLVGEMHPEHKIYVEDYVISYLKQLHKSNPYKEIGVAFYGKESDAEDGTYHFIYGASRVESITKELRHLSQAQLQEVDRIRKSIFPMYRFCGFCIVRTEDTEEIMICEDTQFASVKGYARFYEKNDLMLEQLLSQQGETPMEEPEDRGKYEAAKVRQLERRDYYFPEGMSKEDQRGEVEGADEMEIKPGKGGGWLAVALCCVALFLFFSQGKVGKINLLSQLSQAYQQVKSTVVTGKNQEILIGTNEQNTGIDAEEQDTGIDAEEQDTMSSGIGGSEVAAGAFSMRMESDWKMEEGQEGKNEGNRSIGEEGTAENRGNMTLTEVGTLVTDEALGQVIQEENQGRKEGQEPTRQEEITPEKDNLLPQQAKTEPVKEPIMEEQKEPVSYEIAKGDTLIGISLSRYGNSKMVDEICKLNHIDNPDNIQIGQKVLLP